MGRLMIQAHGIQREVQKRNLSIVSSLNIKFSMLKHICCAGCFAATGFPGIKSPLL